MTENSLPGYNCQQCGQKTCADLLKTKKLDKCPFTKKKAKSNKDIRGVIDGLKADFVFGPLNGEPSCRERLLPLTPGKLKVGDYIRYRPIGCPVTHFGRLIDYTDGLITIHLVGPRLPNIEYKNIGLCLVIGFEGQVVEGKVPEVCQTVKFVPHKCMMRKIHTAVVTHREGNKIKVEGIDLKVWEHAK